MSTIKIAKRYSRTSPCPVCGKDHGCSKTDSGLIFCLRQRGDSFGFRYLGETTGGSWGKYFQDDGIRYTHSHTCRKPAEKTPKPPAAPAAEEVNRFNRLDREFMGDSAGARARLADHLGVLASSLERLGVGYDSSPDPTPHGEDEPHFTIRQLNHQGVTVGFKTRYWDGRKFHLRNTGSGLTYRTDLATTSGPILCPEGMSDTAALDTMGIAAAGRPSNNGGKEMLAMLLGPLAWADFRDIIILGENDENGAGQSGAKATAAEVAKITGVPVKWSLPPEGFKDARGWFNFQVAQRKLKLTDAAVIQALGREFLELVLQNAIEIKPPCEDCRQDWIARFLERHDEDCAPSHHSCKRGVLMRHSNDFRKHRNVITVCGCWSCSDCRLALSKKWNDHFRDLADRPESAAGLFVFRGDSSQWRTVSMRVRRLGGKFFKIDAPGDQIVAIANVAADGFEPLEKSQAIEQVAEAIDNVPNVKKPISTSVGWGLPKPEVLPNKDYRRVGHRNGVSAGQVAAEARSLGAIEIKVIAKNSTKVEKFVDFSFPTTWPEARVWEACDRILGSREGHREAEHGPRRKRKVS